MNVKSKMTVLGRNRQRNGRLKRKGGKKGPGIKAGRRGGWGSM